MLANLVGFNFRLTELCAAVGVEQLKKIDLHVERRESLARRLTEAVSELPGLLPPVVREGCRHVSYVWALRFDEVEVGATRTQFSRALLAEGFPHFTGYVRPLYLLPLFQRRIAFGNDGYPFSLSNVRYFEGMCPVAERMYAKELICFETCMYDIDVERVELLVKAIRKVYEHRVELSRLT